MSYCTHTPPEPNIIRRRHKCTQEVAPHQLRYFHTALLQIRELASIFYSGDNERNISFRKRRRIEPGVHIHRIHFGTLKFRRIVGGRNWRGIHSNRKSGEKSGRESEHDKKERRKTRGSWGRQEGTSRVININAIKIKGSFFEIGGEDRCGAPRKEVWNEVTKALAQYSIVLVALGGGPLATHNSSHKYHVLTSKTADASNKLQESYLSVHSQINMETIWFNLETTNSDV